MADVQQPVQAPAATPAPSDPNSLQAAMGAIGAQYNPQFAALNKQRQEVQAGEQKQLAAQPKVEPPSGDFHPALKDMSDMAGMMMVLGALGGRNTMNPMAASLNNMTGVMTGMKEGNEEQIKLQKEQFDTNYKAGVDKYKAYIEERNNIINQAHGNMDAIRDQVADLNRRIGVDEKMAQAVESGKIKYDQIISQMEMKKQALDNQFEMMKMRQEMMQMQIDSRERVADKQIGARSEERQKKDVFTLQNEKTKALAKLKPGTPAYKQQAAQFDAAIQAVQQGGGNQPPTSKDPLGLFD